MLDLLGLDKIAHATRERGLGSGFASQPCCVPFSVPQPLWARSSSIMRAACLWVPQTSLPAHPAHLVPSGCSAPGSSHISRGALLLPPSHARSLGQGAREQARTNWQPISLCLLWVPAVSLPSPPGCSSWEDWAMGAEGKELTEDRLPFAKSLPFLCQLTLTHHNPLPASSAGHVLFPFHWR